MVGDRAAGVTHRLLALLAVAGVVQLAVVAGGCLFGAVPSSTMAWLHAGLVIGILLLLELGVLVLAAVRVRRLARLKASPWLRFMRSLEVRAQVVLAGASFVLAALLALACEGNRIEIPAPAAGLTLGASRPPIVLVVLDTVRADHLPAYGYPRPTMPDLERFGAAAAARWERAVATAPLSLESHASIFTGLGPSRHGAHLPRIGDPLLPAGAYPLPSDVPTLAATLAKAGYWTVGVSANHGPLSPALGLGRGFAVYHAMPDPAWERRNRFFRFSPAWQALRLAPLVGLRPDDLRHRLMGPSHRPGGDVTRAALDVLERAGDRSFFLFLNYFDAHFPYPPAAGEARALLGRDFESETFRGAWWTRSLEPILSGARILAEAETAELGALYDVQLMRLDAALSPLFERLRHHPRWAEMTVVVTSDHGESLGDHGLVGHGSDLFDDQLRVPLWIKSGDGTAAGPPAGATVQGLFSLVDLFPTLVAAAGLEVPPGLDGRTWGRGRTEARAWLYRPAHLAAVSPRFDRELRSLERGGWKLIASTRDGNRLFHLPADPTEAHDMAVTEGAVTAELLAALGPAEPTRASAAQPVDPGTVERLRALGYID